MWQYQQKVLLYVGYSSKMAPSSFLIFNRNACLFNVTSCFLLAYPLNQTVAVHFHTVLHFRNSCNVKSCFCVNFFSVIDYFKCKSSSTGIRKAFLWISLNIPSKAIIPSCTEMYGPFKYITKTAHILGLYVWVLLYFYCVFILMFIDLFTFRLKPIKTQGKTSSHKWQKRKRAAKAHAKIWKLKEGSQWGDTVLCVQGNKEESEPFLYLTLLVGERERAANSGLPSK